MHASTRPPVVNEAVMIERGLYNTFTVGYYMGGPRQVPLAQNAQAPLGDDTAGGQYARAGCSCKILGRAQCPVHGRRMGQGCAVPSGVTPGEGSYQGGDVPTNSESAIPVGLAIGLGGAALLGGLFAVGVI